MALYLRRANSEDCDLLFKWANDSLVRANSFSTDKISYEEHVRWFDRLMQRKDCLQYIFMDECIPVGQARITICDDVAEVGYSICSEKRNSGYGSKLLKLVVDAVHKELPEVTKIVGKVKSENIASQKAFAKAGYDEKYRIFEIKMV
ncbi:GNAT family N-acetyltransferase [Agathobacter sp.]|uniref:GNAT family N-acetyltransferase n=1 Tax=Agathobacter sp. TaxID=2021311 RepID=UPI003AB3AB40